MIKKSCQEEVIDRFLEKISGNKCLYSSLNFKDCLHEIGLPPNNLIENFDNNGRPYGWCEICWRGYQIKQLKNYIYELEHRLRIDEKLDNLTKQIDNVALEFEGIAN